MENELNNFYLSQSETNKSCLIALQSIILQQDTDIIETVKYGMPCFCYKKKVFCYLWTDKKTDEPYILFVEGKYLDHQMLEEGTRKRMKIFRVNPNEDLPLEIIVDLLQEAISLYKMEVINVKGCGDVYHGGKNYPVICKNIGSFD